MYGYVEGYAWAARSVYQEALRLAKSPECAVFPLAFLWRHHVELAMKWVIALGRQADPDDDGKVSEGHDLLRLWTQCRKYIEPMGPPEDDGTLANVEFTLAQFHRLDPKGNGWRYPVALKADPVALRDPSPSLTTVPERVSLPQLQEAMEALSTFFGAVVMHMQQKAELRAGGAYDFVPPEIEDEMPF